MTRTSCCSFQIGTEFRIFTRKDLSTSAERPLTDVLIGIIQVSVSADGNKAAIVSLREGTPFDLYAEDAFPADG